MRNPGRASNVYSAAYDIHRTATPDDEPETKERRYYRQHRAEILRKQRERWAEDKALRKYTARCRRMSRMVERMLIWWRSHREMNECPKSR